MIIQKKLYLIGLVSASLLSCNSDNGQANFSSTTTPQTPNTTVAAPALNTSNVTSKTAGTVVHPPTKLGNLMNLNAPTRANFSASGSGLNPAHGMPGHDCAVAVGAPLPGRNVAGPQTISAPVAAASSPNFNLPAAGAKINPAHGQPGHDCAVAVGAPLPSSGGSTAASLATQAVSAPAALTSIAAPAPAASSPNFNLPSANAKINPAHGQPGHDCSVAVGAPLPTTASAKINPAHGQPGHDCSVAVGAPLPS